MAYGAGRSLLYRDVGQEEAREQSIYEKGLRRHEGAVEEEAEESSLWSILTGVPSGILGLLTTGTLKGAATGYTIGSEVGKWAQNLLSDYDPADYALSTDVGKFGVSQKYDIEDINRQFEEAYRSQFWKDVTGTGKSLATLALLNKGSTGEDILSRYDQYWDEFSFEPQRLFT